MQKKNLLRLGFLVIALAASFIALRSSGKTADKSTCKEKLEPCKREQNRGNAPGMIWENLSRQFFSSATFH